MNDKLPPSAIDLEKAVLGAVLMESDSLDVVLPILKKEHFYDEKNRYVWESITRLSKANSSIDLLTVTNDLKVNKTLETVGLYYITSLANNLASSAHIETHARIIGQTYYAREILRHTHNAQSNIDFGTDVFDVGDNLRAALDKAEESISGGGGEEDFAAAMDNVIVNYEIVEKNTKEGKLSGIPSGLYELDRKTNGWQKTDLVILAARPGVGKTALACLFTIIAAQYGKGVYFASLEMSKLQLCNRLAIMQSDMDGWRLSRGKFSPDEKRELKNRIDKIRHYPIKINDKPNQTVASIRSGAKAMKRNGNLELVIVDYLQLMGGIDRKGGNREQEVSAISRGLKIMAKELEVPVIALSQLSRQTEGRSESRPTLVDLRESGAIEQDADSVMFAYRPIMHGIKEDSEGNSLIGIGEIILAKNRHGSMSSYQEIMFRHNESLSNFMDYKKNENKDFTEPTQPKF